MVSISELIRKARKSQPNNILMAAIINYEPAMAGWALAIILYLYPFAGRLCSLCHSWIRHSGVLGCREYVIFNNIHEPQHCYCLFYKTPVPWQSFRKSWNASTLLWNRRTMVQQLSWAPCIAYGAKSQQKLTNWNSSGRLPIWCSAWDMFWHNKTGRWHTGRTLRPTSLTWVHLLM